MKVKFYFGCTFFLVLCYACRPYTKEVEQALRLSGNNKEELIKVLEYYKGKDELKYAAACYLISNMPYHKSEVELKLSNCYFNHFKKIDSICRVDSGAIENDSLKHLLARAFDSIPPPLKLPIKKDIEVLTSTFLINNIECAFYEWMHSPLLKAMSFEEFKEWILPYRTVHESLVDNKRLLKSIIFDQLAKKGMDDIRMPIECYQKYVRQQKAMNAYVTSNHHIGPFDVFIPAFIMDCHNIAARTCNYFRACGIPVVYEFTPQWPDKDSRHYWCASPDSNRVLQPYTPPYNNLREDWDLSLKNSGKVFQRTFGAMKNTPYFLKNKNEIVPSPFDIPTIKDVTERYHLCETLTLPVPTDFKNNLAYLSFFNTKEKLAPVAWGKIDKCKHSVTFYQVPINMLFFPSYLSKEGNVRSFDKPFILKQDTITGRVFREDIVCNTQQKLRMHLLRKYPSKKHLDDCRQNLQGAHLLGANQWDGPYDTLLVIKGVPGPHWIEYRFDNSRKYRYYRFAPRNKLPMDIAEFEFLGKRDSEHTYSTPTKLPVFSSNSKEVEFKEYQKIEGTPMKTGPLYANFFDGNPETYTRWGFLGMDFNAPVCVSRIRFLPRTAMNIIEVGQQYQLLYFKDHKWIEHQTLISEGNYLDIDSVPSGTVYWLRNLDKGKEELPFFYKNGKQIFINQYL